MHCGYWRNKHRYLGEGGTSVALSGNAKEVSQEENHLQIER